jgi:hypothetical protein
MSSLASAGDSDTVQVTATATTDPRDGGFERVAVSLRGARARAGLSEERVVAILTVRGVAISELILRHAECTGVLELALAAHLADAYGTTTDCLAGRRRGRVQAWPIDPAAA